MRVTFFLHFILIKTNKRITTKLNMCSYLATMITFLYLVTNTRKPLSERYDTNPVNKLTKPRLKIAPKTV